MSYDSGYSEGRGDAMKDCEDRIRRLENCLKTAVEWVEGRQTIHHSGDGPPWYAEAKSAISPAEAQQ